MKKSFILAHYNRDMTAKEICAHLGIKQGTLTTYVYKLRKAGFEIPAAKRAHDVGRVTLRRHCGKVYEYIKGADGKYRHKPQGEKQPRKAPENAKTIKDSTHRAKAAVSGEKAAKRRFVANTDRPPIERRPVCRTDRNPDKVKIRKETGRFIPVAGYPVKTWKLSKQEAA